MKGQRNRAKQSKHFPCPDFQALLNVSSPSPMFGRCEAGAGGEGGSSAVLHHSERWYNPVARWDAILTQWRGSAALVSDAGGYTKEFPTLDEARAYLGQAGFVHVSNVDEGT